MKKYAVTFKEVVLKTIEIEAEDFEEAQVIANDMSCDVDELEMDKNMDEWSLVVDSIKEI